MEKQNTGRPSKYEGLNLEQVRILAEKGWTDEEMSEFFGVCRKTWHNWKEEHSEFLHTLKNAKAISDSKVIRALFERATGYEHPHQEVMMAQKKGEPVIVDTVKRYPPDPTSMIFWLKNRLPNEWRDKTHQDITLDKLSPEQIDELYNRLLKTLNDDDNENE
jgi:hypothetical protein